MILVVKDDYTDVIAEPHQNSSALPKRTIESQYEKYRMQDVAFI